MDAHPRCLRGSARGLARYGPKVKLDQCWDPVSAVNLATGALTDTSGVMPSANRSPGINSKKVSPDLTGVLEEH